MTNNSNTPQNVLGAALGEVGPWYGPDGVRNHYAFDVLFSALNHVLAAQGDGRALHYLRTRRTASSVAWLESHLAWRTMPPEAR